MKPARSRSITWRGRRVTAHIPHPLTAQRLTLRDATSAKCASASARLMLTAEIVPTDFAHLTHLLARNEAIASSHIEGVTAPAVDSVLPASNGIAQAIHDAIDTVRFVREGSTNELDIEILLDWHNRLMTSSPLSREVVGVLRMEQGWIGGTSPLDAALVTPPPDELPGLIADLVTFANRTDLDPVMQAAVLHAQFELIHPFADGNGRVGRLLIDWSLCRRLRLVAPPSFSAAITSDLGAYLSGLTMFRLGDLDSWCSWFADVSIRASQRQLAFVQSVDELRAKWRARLLARADARAWEVLGLIPRFPVLDSQLVADQLSISPRTALTALETLASNRILEEHSRPTGRGRPARLFVSPDLLDLVEVG